MPPFRSNFALLEVWNCADLFALSRLQISASAHSNNAGSTVRNLSHVFPFQFSVQLGPAKHPNLCVTLAKKLCYEPLSHDQSPTKECSSFDEKVMSN